MSYTPNNPAVYFGAFSGTVSGLVANRDFSPFPSSYTQIMNVAGAFARAIDQALIPLGPFIPAGFNYALGVGAALAYWEGRSVPEGPGSTDQAFYDEVAQQFQSGIGNAFATFLNGPNGSDPTLANVTKTPVTVAIPAIVAGASASVVTPFPGARKDGSLLVTLGPVPATLDPGIALGAYRFPSDGNLETVWVASAPTAGQNIDLFVTLF